MDGQKTSEFIVARKITTSFGCFLEVETQVQLAPFELSLREPNQYLIPHLEFAERAELKEASIGIPQLDGLFLVRSADPRTASLLASALNVLSTQLYVHLAGEGNRMWISFSRMGLPYFSGAPEEFLLALETAACGLEGRPAPAGLGAPRQVHSVSA